MTGENAIRTLAERWLPHLGDADFLVSPAGLWLALGAVASGARGRTAEELAGLLGVEGEAAAAAVTAASRSLGGVAAATGVWSTLPIHETFRRGLPDVRFGLLPGAVWSALPDEVFGATDDLSLGELPDPREELDAWVRAASGGLLPGLPLALDGSEDLVLLSVLALKATWRVAFARELTGGAPFTDGDGVTHEDVPTMRQRIPAAWVWSVDGSTVVELPCAATGGGEGPRVRFVLGPEGAGPADVLPAAWAAPGAREPLRADSVDLALPRLTLRATLDARAHLDALGVRRALRPGADFSGISAADLFVAKVVQEAVVEVAEEGVEAAAVTQVVMTRSAAAPRPRLVEPVAFDRPFGTVVLDAGGEVPLFTGWRRSAPGTG